VSLGIVDIEVLNEGEEFLAVTFLKDTQQRAREGLGIGGRHFVDMALHHHVRSIHRLELKIAGHISVDEHLDEDT